MHQFTMLFKFYDFLSILLILMTFPTDIRSSDIQNTQSCWTPVFPSVPCPLPSKTTSQTSQTSEHSTATQSTISTTPIPVTEQTTRLIPVEEDDTHGQEMEKSGPLWRSPDAEQLQCTSAGVNCNNCSWIDWVKIYNKTVPVDTPATLYFHNTDEKTCFQHCNSTTSCVLYTFNKVNGTCKILDTVRYENIKNNSEWSLYVRISPRFIFLSEWIVTLNMIPSDNPFNSTTVTNFLNCTIFCGSQEKCVFAVFDRSSLICYLYTKGATQMMSLKGNVVSIQHMSLLRDDNVWRFEYLGNVYQADPPTIAFTTEITQTCLESCYSRESCQLVTTKSTGESTVDCNLYDYYQNTWYEDDSSPKSTNSYYKAVPRYNTQFKRLPQFATIRNITKPVNVFHGNLEKCHEEAAAAFRCFYYTFNETSQECQLFNWAVQIETSKSWKQFELKTFSKSIPTNYLPQYAYDIFWIFQNTWHETNLPGDNLKDPECIGQCLEIESCNGVAIQKPEGNCSMLTATGLNSIRKADYQSTESGVQSIKVFAKWGDPRFIESTSQFQCLDKPLIS